MVIYIKGLHIGGKIHDMENINTETLAILTAITIGLVQVVKATGLNTKWAPLVSVLIGVGGSLLFGSTVIVGIIAGLSASGLYSGVKTTLK